MLGIMQGALRDFSIITMSGGGDYLPPLQDT